MPGLAVGTDSLGMLTATSSSDGGTGCSRSAALSVFATGRGNSGTDEAHAIAKTRRVTVSVIVHSHARSLATEMR
jgi:hypothetical protein